jgi:hypothetical protein
MHMPDIVSLITEPDVSAYLHGRMASTQTRKADGVASNETNKNNNVDTGGGVDDAPSGNFVSGGDVPDVTSAGRSGRRRSVGGASSAAGSDDVGVYMYTDLRRGNVVYLLCMVEPRVYMCAVLSQPRQPLPRRDDALVVSFANIAFSLAHGTVVDTLRTQAGAGAASSATASKK